MTTQPVGNTFGHPKGQCPHGNPLCTGCNPVAALAEAPSVNLGDQAYKNFHIPSGLGGGDGVLDQEICDLVDEMISRRDINGPRGELRRPDDVRFDVRQLVPNVSKKVFDEQFDKIEGAAEEVSMLESAAQDPDEDTALLDYYASHHWLPSAEERVWRSNNSNDEPYDFDLYADEVISAHNHEVEKLVSELVYLDRKAAG